MLSFEVASLGHLAIGLAAARFATPTGSSRRLFYGRSVALMGLSMLPDADVVGFAFGIAYGAPFGHRGASHSFVFAILVGLGVGLLARGLEEPRPLGTAVLVTLVVASHPVLDAFTDGGLGCALLWPFSNERFFWPVTPIPVAPIGIRFVSGDGLRVALTELLIFLPIWAYALWPRRANA